MPHKWFFSSINTLFSKTAFLNNCTRLHTPLHKYLLENVTDNCTVGIGRTPVRSTLWDTRPEISIWPSWNGIPQNTVAVLHSLGIQISVWNANGINLRCLAATWEPTVCYSVNLTMIKGPLQLSAQHIWPRIMHSFNCAPLFILWLLILSGSRLSML